MSTMIFGTVYDSGSTVLTGATVTVPGCTVSNNNGSYFVNVPGTGTYQVTASCANYTPKTTPVAISFGQLKSQDFHLNHI